MLNLIQNAIKFTPPGGSISVALKRPEGAAHAELVVTDTGMGIPPSFLPKVFEMFAQAGELTAKRRSGLGIGLNLVKSIVEMHGGTITAASEGEGKGAAFTIRLPLAKIRNTQRRLAPVETAAALPAKQCLIIEDDEETRRTLRDLMESLECTVVTAASGAEGVQAAAAQRPDVVLCDLAMPDMDGFGFLSAWKGHPEFRIIPVIAVSGLPPSEARARARQAGFAAHLTKPVELATLERTLRDLLTACREGS
jgi:two-component system CheB/CheR fusion protein